MAEPSPKWYDSSNVELSAAVAFGTVTPGVPSAAVEVRLINNLGGSGADPLANAHLLVLSRETGDDEFHAAGHEVVDRYYVELRVVGGYQSNPPLTPWTPLGAGVFFQLPQIANDEGIRFEVRINPPADSEISDPEVAFRVVQSPSEVLQTGISESGPDGVYHGLGDGGAYEHVLATDVAENGTPDDDVQPGLQVWVSEGEVYTKVPALVNLPASAAGKERFDVLSLANDGTIEVTTGTEVTAPASPDTDLPAVPAGNLPLCHVLVDDSGVITDGEITQTYTRGYFGAVGNGLNLEVGGGTAIVDNALVLRQTLSVLPLVASSTNWVWLLRDGTFAVAQTAAKPENRALLLYEATTNGSSVTALVDRRVFVGGEMQELVFRWDGTVVVNEERGHVLASPRTARILPVGGVVASVLSIGDGTGGQLRFAVEVDDGGGFATLFTTGEQPPEIAFDADPLTDFDAIPEVWAIPGFSRVKAEPSTLPTGAGTDPSDAVLVLRVVL